MSAQVTEVLRTKLSVPPERFYLLVRSHYMIHARQGVLQPHPRSSPRQPSTPPFAEGPGAQKEPGVRPQSAWQPESAACQPPRGARVWGAAPPAPAAAAGPPRAAAAVRARQWPAGHGPALALPSGGRSAAPAAPAAGGGAESPVTDPFSCSPGAGAGSGPGGGLWAPRPAPAPTQQYLPRWAPRPAPASPRQYPPSGRHRPPPRAGFRCWKRSWLARRRCRRGRRCAARSAACRSGSWARPVRCARSREAAACRRALPRSAWHCAQGRVWSLLHRL